MFTSATGYIFSFGLSRRRHEPPFKPGGSVGALVGRPGFRAGFARIRARGRGRGSVGAACSSRKKPLDCRLAIQLSSNLLSSKAASLRGRPVFPCLLCVPTTWCANDGASVASQGRFPVATGLSLCLYLNCAPEAGKESSGSLGLFLAFAAGVAAVPPPSPDATPFKFWPCHRWW